MDGFSRNKRFFHGADFANTLTALQFARRRMVSVAWADLDNKQLTFAASVVHRLSRSPTKSMAGIILAPHLSEKVNSTWRSEVIIDEVVRVLLLGLFFEARREWLPPRASL